MLRNGSNNGSNNRDVRNCPYQRMFLKQAPFNINCPSEAKQVANNHNRDNSGTISTQMSGNYDPLSAGKHSITSQFPQLAGQLRVELFPSDSPGRHGN